MELWSTDCCGLGLVKGLGKQWENIQMSNDLATEDRCIYGKSFNMCAAISKEGNWSLSCRFMQTSPVPSIFRFAQVGSSSNLTPMSNYAV